MTIPAKPQSRLQKYRLTATGKRFASVLARHEPFPRRLRDVSISTPILLSLTVTYYPAINYAFQQNAIPVVEELWFQNDGVARKNLVIRVTTEPAFAAPVEDCSLCCPLYRQHSDGGVEKLR